MHIAVCDDNIADRKQMERLLQRASDKRLHTTGVFYVDSYGNVDAVMRSPMLYDAFFIDMTTGPVNGFQLSRRLIDAGATAPIILCVSTIDYRAIVEAAIEEAPEAVPEEGTESAKQTSNHVILRRQLKSQIMYLDKPVKVAELDQMLDLALAHKQSAVPTIELRGETTTYYVYEDEILYARKNAQYVHVTLTENRELDILSDMQNFYAQIKRFPHFKVVSEQLLVNISHIEKFSFSKIYMKNGQNFIVSPITMSALKKAYESLPHS